MIAERRPLVSVLIPNYNYARFLDKCLGSVLAQTYDPVEIVVVDDGSTDDSRVVLEKYGSRIKTVWQANQGQAAALSAGFTQCRGDIICLLDADDGWYPDKVQVIVDTFAAHPRVEWVRHKLAFVRENLEPYDRVIPDYNGSSLLTPDPLALIERIMTAGTAVAMRRSLAERVFPLHLDEDMRVEADDTILLAKMVEAGALGFSLDRVLGFYRRHSSHRFSVDDLGRLLTHEAEVSTVLARMFGSRRVPVAVYKYHAIVAALGGAAWWHKDRLGNYVAGLGSALALWRRPALCARQAAALTFALVAPTVWIDRLKRSQSFYEPEVHVAH